MSPREWLARWVQRRCEPLFRQDVTLLIIRELGQSPLNVRLVGIGPGPLGRTSWLWAYETRDWLTREEEHKVVWTDRRHKIIRRYERPT